MRPVQQAAQVIPFVLAAKAHTVTEPKRHAIRKLEVVSDQQCLPIP